jgi:hypothetical protein
MGKWSGVKWSTGITTIFITIEKDVVSREIINQSSAECPK